MRLVEYIESGRSKTITVEKAGELLKTTHSKAYKSKYRIFRGINGGGTDFLYIDPSKGELRQSRNAKNYYTLIMDNSQDWKSYPKRSRSLICTTDITIADDYGTVYNVYPENNAKIGVCPEPDIWISFQSSSRNDDSLEDITIFIEWLLKIHGLDDIPGLETDYNKLVKAFSGIDKWKFPIPNDKTRFGDFVSFYDSFLKSGVKFIDYMQDYLSPSKNGFKIVKTDSQIDNDNEVWTDAPCVMVMCMPSTDERLNDYIRG